MTIQEWIRENVKAKGIKTWAELARRMSRLLGRNFGRDKITKILKDERKVGADELEAMELIFGEKAPPLVIEQSDKASAPVAPLPLLSDPDAAKESGLVKRLFDRIRNMKPEKQAKIGRMLDILEDD